jgi:hypothetical protein
MFTHRRVLGTATRSAGMMLDWVGAWVKTTSTGVGQQHHAHLGTED